MTAWYLTKIEHSFDSNDIITLNYSNNSFTYAASVSTNSKFWDPTSNCGSVGVGSCAPSNCPEKSPCYQFGGENRLDNGIEKSCENIIIASTIKLNEILSNTFGRIKIVYREKTSVMDGKEHLVDKIEIYKPDNLATPMKTFSMNYYFSKGNDSYLSHDLISNAPYNSGGFRSFLISLSEKNQNNTIINSHKFEYDDVDNMAPRLSFSQDHFGYFNGKLNTASFIPLSDGIQTIKQKPVANRESDFVFAKKGMLTKVTYPTGGHSQFYYEGHTNVSAPSSLSIGGVRVNKVVSFDPMKNISITKIYNYGTGVVTSFPIYSRGETIKDNHWEPLCDIISCYSCYVTDYFRFDNCNISSYPQIV